jgi:hypothetical protein
MEFASAQQSGAEWAVILASNSQARSTLTIRNQCKQTHSFTVAPKEVPYLQLPAMPTVKVPGLTNQSLAVLFNTVGMRPGDYRGSVEVKCETCGEEKGCSQENEILPVHLTVTPAAGVVNELTGNSLYRPSPSPSPRYEVSPTPTPTPTPRVGYETNLQNVKIMGQKVNDVNCNGKIDTNEPTNTGGGAAVSTVTDANGFYYFNNLAAGTYTISEVAQAGWTQSMPGGSGSYTVTVSSGLYGFNQSEVIRKDFANCKKHEEVGRISGRKINDLNCNGKTDVNEPGLAGWVITATNNGGGPSAVTVTDATGFYVLYLGAGTYTISENPQTGWTQTMPGVPGTYAVTVAAGQSIEKNFLNCKKSNDNKECATVTAREPVCKTDGSGYTYMFSVTNNSGKDVEHILLTPGGGGLTLSQQVVDTPLHPGQSTTITVDIGNVKPGSESCFFVTLMTKDGPCCTVKVCPVLPDCCATAKGEFKCDAKGGYTGTFSIVNTSPNTIKNIYLYPPAGVTLSQTYFAVNLAPGQSFTTPVITIKGAKPGRLCFRVSMHTEDMKDCCEVEFCIVLPECGIHIIAAATIFDTTRTPALHDPRWRMRRRFGKA